MKRKCIGALGNGVYREKLKRKALAVGVEGIDGPSSTRNLF